MAARQPPWRLSGFRRHGGRRAGPTNSGLRHDVFLRHLTRRRYPLPPDTHDLDAAAQVHQRVFEALDVPVKMLQPVHGLVLVTELKQPN